MSTNVMAWNEDQRRTGSFVVLGVAVVAVLGGVAAWWFAGAATPGWVYWTLVGLLALVLVFMAVLLFAPARAAAPVAESAAPHAAHQHAAPVEAAAPAAAYEPRILTLRCGDCGTIFELTDTGERPLYHTCPGCGAEGALRDPVEAAPAAEAAPSAYAPPYPDAVQAEPAPSPAVEAAPAPAAPAVKKIKLRCGGCKEVFSIEDTGERPLKRACPHCGRVGKIG